MPDFTLRIYSFVVMVLNHSTILGRGDHIGSPYDFSPNMFSILSTNCYIISPISAVIISSQPDRPPMMDSRIIFHIYNLPTSTNINFLHYFIKLTINYIIDLLKNLLTRASLLYLPQDSIPLLRSFNYYGFEIISGKIRSDKYRNQIYFAFYYFIAV